MRERERERESLQVSFDLPEYTAEVDAVGTLRLLDAIHACGLTEKVASCT